MFQRIIPLLILLPLSILAQANENVWQKITPLSTTRSEVRRLLGEPIDKMSNIYDIDNARVTIWFSNGGCKTNKAQWNVPKDTVIGFIVAPKTFLSVSSVIRSLKTEFDRSADPEMEGRFVYQNKDRSITIDTSVDESKREDVLFVAFNPSTNNFNARCPQVQGKSR